MSQADEWVGRWIDRQTGDPANKLAFQLANWQCYSAMWRFSADRNKKARYIILDEPTPNTKNTRKRHTYQPFWVPKIIGFRNSCQSQTVVNSKVFPKQLFQTAEVKNKRTKKGQASGYIALRNQKRKRRREKTQDWIIRQKSENDKKLKSRVQNCANS